MSSWAGFFCVIYLSLNKNLIISHLKSDHIYLEEQCSERIQKNSEEYSSEKWDMNAFMNMGMIQIDKSR